MARKLVILFILILSFSSFAKEVTDTADASEPLVAEVVHAQNQMKRSKEVLSKKIDAFARGLDAYLAGDLEADKNETQLIINNAVDWDEREGWYYKPNIDLRLHLPKVEKRLKLRFTNYDTETEEQGVEGEDLRPPSDKESYGASLYFLKPFKGFDFTYRPRLRFNKSPELTHLFRFDKRRQYGTLTVDQKIEFFARSETGMGQLYGVYLYKDIGDTYLLGLQNTIQYISAGTLLSTNHNLFLNKQLSSRRSIRSGFNHQSNNDPEFKLQRYTYYISYSQEISKDFIRIKLTPRMDYERSYAFSGDPGALFELALIF